ncbi:HVA22-like protein F, partial [Prunus dulcis]
KTSDTKNPLLGFSLSSTSRTGQRTLYIQGTHSYAFPTTPHISIQILQELICEQSDSISSSESSESMGVLAAVAKNLDTLIGPGVMLLYPLYASMRAIESPSALDDQQWLTIPIWPYMKLLFCMWLVLPIYNGAAYIYENIVRKYVKLGGYMVSSNKPDGQKKVLQMMSLDARRSVERFIDQHGIDAFERVVKAAEKEARKY